VDAALVVSKTGSAWTMYAHAPEQVGSLPPLGTLKKRYCAPLLEKVVSGEQSTPAPENSAIIELTELPKAPFIAIRNGPGFPPALV
jgi:hypothetical protein